jgi:hypothetical protein
MAHYAFLDENNIVTEVIVGKEENEDGIDWEQHYGNFRGQTCKRTSYNTIHGEHKLGGTPFRLNYAGIGFTYNETLDGFIGPKPFDSWVLDESKGKYNSPVAYPETFTQNLTDKITNEPLSDLYLWDEEMTSWTLQTD